MAIDLSPTPFTWGAGGARMTPEAIASQRKVAQAMMQQGMDYSPIQSPWQGAARVAQAMLGGFESGQADAAAKANQEAEAKLLSEVLSGGATSAPTVAPATPAAAADPMGANAIPAGQPDASLSDAISKVAAARGVDPAYMTRLAMVESGGKLDARSLLSSASGPFQFLNSTARQYGLNNPMDPAASADAAARFTLDNKAALAQKLGREPTPGELYLAHQQGAGAAANLLANPDAPVESIIGPAAARNNGATPGMTAGQFASKWTGKFGDIVQTVDPAQKNILDAAADQPATAVAQADPAALPVNAQAAQGFAIPGQGATPAAAPGVNPALVRAMSSPYVSDGTKKILGLVLNQQMEAAQKAADPMRQLQIRKLEYDLATGKNPEIVREYEYAKKNGYEGTFQDWIASKRAGAGEYSLTPVYGKDAQGNTVLIQPGKSGTAVQTKLPEGVTISSGVDKIDLGTQWGIIDKRTGQIVGYQPKDLKGAESAKAEGKAQGAAVSEYQSITSKMPGLEKVVQDLDELSNRATYTMAGQAFDAGVRQLGFAPRDAAVARAEYTAKVDNQVLPLLRDTFGAQFTEREGATLRATLGDPNKSPQEKQAVLRAFIEQKRRDIEALASRTGQPAPQQKQGTKRLRFNPTTGALE